MSLRDSTLGTLAGLAIWTVVANFIARHQYQEKKVASGKVAKEFVEAMQKAAKQGGPVTGVISRDETGTPVGWTVKGSEHVN